MFAAPVIVAKMAAALKVVSVLAVLTVRAWPVDDALVLEIDKILPLVIEFEPRVNAMPVVKLFQFHVCANAALLIVFVAVAAVIAFSVVLPPPIEIHEPLT